MLFSTISFRVTLPDGAIKEGRKWISTPMDIATVISSEWTKLGYGEAIGR